MLMSNFFRVDDEREFGRFVRKWDLVPKKRDYDQVGFQRVGKESFGIPRAHIGADGRPVAGDIFRDLAAIISEDEVAIVMESVIHPARAIIRLNAVAVKKGEDPIRLSLNQIYEMAFTKWGVIPSKIDWGA
jgi:hypothetical protein